MEIWGAVVGLSALAQQRLNLRPERQGQRFAGWHLPLGG